MKIYYDLHIHSALSPCANNDMTPGDIVNMAVLNGLGLIAVTDHNTFGNCEAVWEAAGQKDILCLPGAEIETREEVHVLCLFQDLFDAKKFEGELAPRFSQLKNRKDIYGDQLLMDSFDRITGEEERLLVTATDVGIDELPAIVHSHGGLFIPAHIDKEAYSLISNLGFVPGHLPIDALEVTPRGQEEFRRKNPDLFSKYHILSNSDAHYLWDISEKVNFLELADKSAEAVFDCLKGKN